jgi:HSP90 family molecular chaperone
METPCISRLFQARSRPWAGPREATGNRRDTLSPRFQEVAVSERETESFEFQAEVKQLLDLMIHSLYSNTDVFLRELISNASDALDRLRFAGLTNSDLLPDDELEIALRIHPEERLLTVSDNGVGMSRDEVVRDIGTIAKSGAAEFLAALKEKQGKEVPPELIGQFGVGFYASFMAADRVTVLTRKAGEDAATHWESTGAGGFSVEEKSRPTAGTDVTLHLKPAGGDGATADYANEWVLRQIVRKYSDFVAYPIRLEVVGAEKPEGGNEPLNSMKAIWTRPASEVSEDEHKEFYKHISHDWSDPLLHVSTRIEGTFDATALLYVPSVAPYDLYHREMAHRGIQLYVKRVFVMDECRELMPEYLRFVKGVVDAEDLSLNVSREMLQQDRQIEAIRKHLVKKVLEALGDLKRTDFERYLGFFAQFGPVLKEGMLDPREKRERVLDLVLCVSTAEAGKLTGVAEAVDRMPDDQDVIYFAPPRGVQGEGEPGPALHRPCRRDLARAEPAGVPGQAVAVGGPGRRPARHRRGAEGGRSGAQAGRGRVRRPRRAPPRRLAGPGEGGPPLAAAHLVARLPRDRGRRDRPTHRGDPAPGGARGAADEADPRGQSVPPAAGEAEEPLRRRCEGPPRHRIRRAAPRPGAAGRGRPARRPGGLQPQARGPDDPGALIPGTVALASRGIAVG